MRLLIILITFSRFVNGFTQVYENFSDGDFSTNPAWSGSTSDFLINTSRQLQTNQSIANTSFLTTAHGLSTLDDIEWTFKVKQSFSPSASNFGRFYLTASTTDPTSNPDGYFIQFGEAGSMDAVRLFKQESGTATQICEGPTGAIATSFEIKVKVKRATNGDWSLYTDDTGGTNFQLHQTSNDPSYLLGANVIWQCTYTASNAKKFYLDDLYVGPEFVDVSAPVLLSASFTSNISLKAVFNESLDEATANNVSNYGLQPFQSIASAVVNALNPTEVDLTLSFPLQNGTEYTFFASNMKDLAGNDTTMQSLNFTYLISEEPEKGDVIINEIMADPTPVAGLPEYEFVEVYNRSQKYFDTKEWKLGDASSLGTLSPTILGPGEYILLVSNAALSEYPEGTGVSSFPSINNGADDIILTDSTGEILDRLSFNDDWYQSTIKKEGGYSLERIQPFLVCSSSQNWTASNHANGGTPKDQNSVFSNQPDTIAPTIEKVTVLGNDGLQILFSEPIDSLNWMNASVTTSPELTILNRYASTQFVEDVLIQFAENLIPSQYYNLIINGITDCSTNGQNLKKDFILGELPQIGDLGLNEILFNPKDDGKDYVEVNNVSQKVLNLKGLRFGRIVGDTIQYTAGLPSDYLLSPNELVVFTEDSVIVKEQYQMHGDGNFVILDLPSYDNDSGTVILAVGEMRLDEVSYFEEWHFKLLDSKDGKALERINPFLETNRADNWHTASEAVGFGTPGLSNSQFRLTEKKSVFTLENMVISPDNDGFEDVLLVTYSMKEVNVLLNVSMYDEAGRMIRKLKRNELVGANGSFVWDGLTEDGLKASIGKYVLYAEFFSTEGTLLNQWKKAVIVAGKI